MLELFEFSFFRYALFAAILGSVICGIVGSLVVVKKVSSISGGLSHAALGGVGVAYAFGWAPLLGATLFSVAAAGLLGTVYHRQRESLDNLIAIVWSVGMAVGIVCISMTPGYAPDLTSYLFGNILLVERNFLYLVTALAIVTLVTVKLLFKELVATSFDDEFSEVVGVPVERILLVLLILMSLSVVVLIRMVGVILTVSLLTTPAVIARQWSIHLPRMMALATLIAVTCSVGGLFVAALLGKYQGVQLPSGPVIVLLLMVCYLASSLTRPRAS